ncbi:MAG: hypothetical protein IKN87_04960 [Bacilli bacterium]|nr:hypothetical protein [Bacilli bacterium]
MNDLGFENRKAFIERARDERILNTIQNSHMQAPKTRVAREMSNYHKQARFDNNVKMSGMHKENFNMNFNKKI